MVRAGCETEFEGSRTECQSPPPQPSKVCVGVFEGKRPSDKCDFFVVMRESIVVVVDGSVWGSSGISRQVDTSVRVNAARTSCNSQRD